MKGKLVFKITITLVTLAAIATFGMVAYNLTNSSKTNNTGNGAISLEAPLFTSVAEAATKGGDAFPEDVAGIAAYVKVDGTIGLKEVTPIFTETEELGDNYTIGTVPISALVGDDIDVRLYADTDGWLVAYLERGEPAAKIMQWGEIDPANPEIGAIKSTILEDTLDKVGEATGVRIVSDEIKYYHFKFPDANNMTLFVKTRGKEYGTSVVQIEIPATYMLFEASYYNYCGGYDHSSSLKVDGEQVSRVGSTNLEFGEYEEAIKTGVPHKIEIEGSYSGVATMLIYKAE